MFGGGREYGAPPPFFTTPPNPYNPRYHSTYVPGKQPAVNSEQKNAMQQLKLTRCIKTAVFHFSYRSLNKIGPQSQFQLLIFLKKYKQPLEMS